MIGSSPLARAIFTGLAIWLLLQLSGVAVLTGLSTRLGEWVVWAVFVVPVVLGIAAGAWAYRRPPPTDPYDADDQ